MQPWPTLINTISLKACSFNMDSEDMTISSQFQPINQFSAHDMTIRRSTNILDALKPQ
jgi:hypothetical protein